MSDPVEFRSVAATERAEALALWGAVFPEPPGFFGRYYHADPSYQDGDTLGAWDAGRLVSAVHLCRRSVVWDGGTLLCGLVANVATRPDARRQGLSRRLLAQLIQKMERERFDFSLLGTGTPNHYTPLGWETAASPCYTISPGPNQDTAQWQPLDTLDALPDLADAAPRPLNFVRPRSYWEHWIWAGLRRVPTLTCLLPGRGYLLISIPDDANCKMFVPEWCAVNAASERELLQAAAGEASRRGRPLVLAALPQHLPPDFYHTLGTVTMKMDVGPMARSIRLPEKTFQDVLDAYHSGAAVWWAGDRG